MKEPMKYKKKLLTYMLYIFLFLVLVFPFFGTLAYVIPAADDFSFAGDMQRYGGDNIKGVFNMVKDNYFHWQGSFFGTFLIGAVNPLQKFGVKGISLFLIVVLILFILIIMWMVSLFLRKTYKNAEKTIILISILLVAGSFNARIPKEILFWYTGSCAYTVPLLCAFLGVILLLKYYQEQEQCEKNKFLLIGSATFGFLASGGALQITGFTCWCYLLLLIFTIIKRKKVKMIGMVFIIVLAGGLLNTLAPGNFVRRDLSYESISIIQAVYYTFIAIINELEYIFSQTYVPWLFLLFTVIAFIGHKPIKEQLYHPLVVGTAVILSWFISTFPVCFGYGNSTIEQRGLTILDIFIVQGVFLIINSLINYIKGFKKIVLTCEGITLIMIFSFISIGYLQSRLPVSTMPSLRCLQKLVSGETQQFSMKWKEIFKEIEGTEGSEVNLEISSDLLDRDMILMFPELSENPDKWVNGAVAIYYGKDKLNVFIKEVESQE